MTMDEIKNMQDDFLTPAVVASVLKMDIGRLRGYAKDGQLPFPVVISGDRVKIPRIAFLKHYGLISEEQEKNSQIAQLLKELISEIHALREAFGGIGRS